MEDHMYEFVATRAYQAGGNYYLFTCPMKLIPKIFSFNEEDVPPEMRAQRELNKSRIPEIRNYLLNNPNEYVFSALTATVDRKIDFIPASEDLRFRNIGVIKIPMDARIIINDGQHRRAAIQEAIKESSKIGNDQIGIILFFDRGLERSQQMFADLNRHAVRPTKSLGILYDHREPLAQLTKQIASGIEVFNGMTEMNKTSLSNRSTKLFTLSGIYHATAALLEMSSHSKKPIPEEKKKLALSFWQETVQYFPEWKLAKKKQVSTHDLRQQYIHAHGICLQALGRMGAALIKKHPENWQVQLNPLSNIDWLKNNISLWEGRSMLAGRVNKSRQNVLLTTIVLKKVLELPLSEEEEFTELNFQKRFLSSHRDQ